MTDAREEHDEKVSIGSRAEILPICGLPTTDSPAEEKQELETLVQSLDKTCTRYKMEISAEKKRAEAVNCNKLQVPWSSCFR